MGRLIDAVETLLKAGKRPYIAVDEAKKALFAGARLKSFYFVVYFPEGKNWLVGCGQPSKDDRADLIQWREIFGDGFQVALAIERKGGIVFKAMEGGELLTLAGSTTDVPPPPTIGIFESESKALSDETAFSSSKTSSSTSESPPPPITVAGQQIGLLGERYDGGIAGGKSGRLFGDIRRDPPPISRKAFSQNQNLLF